MHVFLGENGKGEGCEGRGGEGGKGTWYFELIQFLGLFIFISFFFVGRRGAAWRLFWVRTVNEEGIYDG